MTDHESDGKLINLQDMKLGLGRMKRLLKKLNSPQEKVNIIHVAGTNGKGSTVSFLREILCAAGYRVGTFMSPAVFDPYEVLTIGHDKITKEEYEKLYERVFVCTKTMEDDPPTPFERLTALAYLFFSEQNVQIALIETGLGGDEDSTNCYGDNQLLSVITPIGKDHCAFLGDTIYEIAFHKAGIIRAKKPVVLSFQCEEARDVLCKKAKSLSCRIFEADKSLLTTGKDKGFFTYDTFGEMQVQVLGDFQIENAITALEAVKALRMQGFSVSNEACKQGIFSMNLPGRLEEISYSNGMFILDGAHNPPAAKRLRQWLDEEKVLPMMLIIGTFSDKAYEEVLHTVMDNNEDHIQKVACITANGQRALESTVLKETVLSLFPDLGKKVTALLSMKDAIEDGKAFLTKDDDKKMVLIFGSLSFLKEARDHIWKED